MLIRGTRHDESVSVVVFGPKHVWTEAGFDAESPSVAYTADRIDLSGGDFLADGLWIITANRF